MMRAVVFVLAALALVAGEKLRFDNYTVYRVEPKNQHQLKFLNGLADKYEDVYFWKDAKAVNRSADIMVSPRLRSAFLESLEAKGIQSKVYVENVQKLIDNERPAMRKPRPAFGWEDYYSLEDINAWLDSVVASNPGVVSIVVGGSSYEGREIRGVKISFGSGNPAVVIEGGMHAREWISAATVTWFINEILTSTDPSVQNVVQSFDFYIFPSGNPDGYEYTWTTNRMWRKTRQPYFLCVGADPNRNFDFHWEEEGASSFPCSETYAGSEAFSEIETRSFSEFVSGLGDDLQVYLSFHSYSQLLMYPYGLSSVVAPNQDELQQIVEKAGRAISQRYGTQYSVGSIVETIYAAAGSSIDWAMGVLGKRFAFVWELRGEADGSQGGFLLPADQIIPTSQETWDSVVSILEDVLAATRKR